MQTSLGGEIWARRKNGGRLPVVRHGTVEAQLSSDGEVAWPIGPFLSDSVWENL